jgi:DNA polymerase III subunit epsilon
MERTSRWWRSRVNPGRPVTATHVYGIRQADVADAPAFAEIVPTLNEFLAGVPVVAHNAAFDLAFLRAEYAYAGWELPFLPTLCTLEASERYLPGLARRLLVDCCWACRVTLDDAHSAVGDARATAGLPDGGLFPRSAPIGHVGRLPSRCSTCCRLWPVTSWQRPPMPSTSRHRNSSMMATICIVKRSGCS